MKNILLLLIIILAAACFADEIEEQYLPNATLLEISAQTNIPVKKIVQYLALDEQPNFNISILELGISGRDVEKAISDYHDKKMSFYTGIVVLGMSIVFASLFITGLIINSLKHLSKTKKKVEVQTSVGTVTAPKGHISSNGIVAAITAIFLHDAEERDKIELTWKRQAISVWQAAGMVENKVFESRRGKI